MLQTYCVCMYCMLVHLNEHILCAGVVGYLDLLRPHTWKGLSDLRDHQNSLSTVVVFNNNLNSQNKIVSVHNSNNRHFFHGTSL